jgi:hypothetical protein
MKITMSQKKSILKRAQQYRDFLLPPECDPRKCCFFHAIAMQKALRDHKVDSMICGGCASFQFIPDSMDDGVRPTHYSYVYEGWNNTFSETEIHCWVMIKQPMGWFIIDTTTQYLMSLCQTAGFEWKSPHPPEILWSHVACLPKGWVYTPYEEATHMVNQVAANFIRQIQSNSIAIAEPSDL